MELKCLLLNNACSHLIFDSSTMQSASILSENSLRDANTYTPTHPPCLHEHISAAQLVKCELEVKYAQGRFQICFER